ncbi:PREDICTED: uncharacterized protein LOC104815481 [Tarenaya hassleriana]|uniref:uncharacterized protein LOC104815481 n=1 Tax=Tarenaya hassleriana TaxID=28532 RepID=UPI00053CA617|nr:PREDICTED: uncharacterized protein LOC104815481 [Tarenaya hassleriana]
MARERNEQMAMQSSIALLQERFRQLQRAKEMRAQRELQNTTSSSPKSPHHQILQCNDQPTRFSFFQFLPLNPQTTSQVASLSLCLDSEADIDEKSSFCLWPNLKDKSSSVSFCGSVDDNIGGFDRNNNVDTSLHL